MDETQDKAPFAWQPFTPRGVAAFGRASFGRVYLVQFLVALLAAGAIVWFLSTRWFPTVTQAISQLPWEGEIRAGQLAWTGDSPQKLAESPFLALIVDVDHRGDARSPAQLQVEFGRSDFDIISLFGIRQERYPRDWSVAFNQAELKPWWGAWQPPVLAMAAGGVIAGLMLVWSVLALPYGFCVWLLALFTERELSLAGAWRLAGAALLPGALALVGAIVLYGFGVIEIIGLLVAFGLHFLLGWVWLLLGALATPKLTKASLGNPFQPAPCPAGVAATGEPKRASENPFKIKDA